MSAYAPTLDRILLKRISSMSIDGESSVDVAEVVACGPLVDPTFPAGVTVLVARYCGTFVSPSLYFARACDVIATKVPS